MKKNFEDNKKYKLKKINKWNSQLFFDITSLRLHFNKHQFCLQFDCRRHVGFLSDFWLRK